MTQHDLLVQPLSDALEGCALDIIVSGSIAAVESVRFIRALRRLGADVYPWLTQGGSQFLTPMSLAWAAARPVTEHFNGAATHIALHDACIIAPASASILGKIAQGITDSPATALVASYLGQGKPVFYLPNMHDSLAQSPMVAHNVQKLSGFMRALGARKEEGKHKFPNPHQLADEVAHHLKKRDSTSSILLTMGTTRGYLDDIRYISNYSSGALGSKIAEELYRQGFSTYVIAGPAQIMPQTATQIIHVETNVEMEEAVKQTYSSAIRGAIFAASVLDFVPCQRREGKIRSHEDLKVDFQPTVKIIDSIQANLLFKVGFKLEPNISPDSRLIAHDYLERYKLSHLVMNAKQDVSSQQHKARIYAADHTCSDYHSKQDIAVFLVKEARRVLDIQAS